jgi:multiple sugar transport system permease protein
MDKAIREFKMIKSNTNLKKVKSLTIHFMLIVGGLMMAFPFLWMMLTAFKSSQEVINVDQWFPKEKIYWQDTKKDNESFQVEVIEEYGEASKIKFFVRRDPIIVDNSQLTRKTWLFSNFVKAWHKVQPSFGRYFVNTIVIAIVVTAGQVMTSILAAYAFVFFQFPFKNYIFTLFLATMMVPQQVLLIPNYLILSGLGWIDTYMALIIPWLAGVFGIFLLRQFFVQIPMELFEAAIIDGCSKWGFLFRILIPLSKPPIITISIFTFLGSWNSLLWPLVVTNSQEMRTIQVGLSYFSQAEGTEWELLMAASAFCILPLILMYIVAQKHFVQGEAGAGLKG